MNLGQEVVTDRLVEGTQAKNKNSYIHETLGNEGANLIKSRLGNRSLISKAFQTLYCKVIRIVC